MKHYLSTLESSMKSGWDRPALCNYRGEIFTNAGLAAEIVKFDLVFSEFGIKKGEIHLLASSANTTHTIPYFSGDKDEFIKRKMLHF